MAERVRGAEVDTDARLGFPLLLGASTRCAAFHACDATPKGAEQARSEHGHPLLVGALSHDGGSDSAPSR